MGAVTPEGLVFCSARPFSGVVNVADRQWFKNALISRDFAPGQFLVGRISGQPGITFGYTLRHADGTPKTLFFAASQPAWLDQLVENFNLREGWEATLMTRSGQIISRYPNPENWRLHQVSPQMLKTFQAAFEQPGFVGELTGFDGSPRVYGVAPLLSTGGEVFVMIGAPLERSLAQVNRDGVRRLTTLLIITLLSALFARFYIYRLIETSIGTLRQAVRKLADGQLDTRVSGLEAAREFEELGHGFNAMADTLEKREAELHRLSSAIEQSPESIVMTDPQANIIYVNRAFTKVTGFTPDEVIGKNPRMLQSGETQPETILISGKPCLPAKSGAASSGTSARTARFTTSWRPFRRSCRPMAASPITSRSSRM
jgi:PAS domain-containing protein